MIYPIDRKDVRMCSELHDKLMELLGKGGIILRVEFRERAITDFWLIEATPNLIAYIDRWKTQSPPLVKAILEDYRAFAPTGVTYGNLTLNDPAAQSTTNNTQVSDPHWLQNIFIQQDAPLDLKMVSWPKWRRFPSNPYGYRATQEDDSTDQYGKRNFHGSCVASKAIGSTDGVSRTTQLSIFKVSSWLSDASWAFAQVRNSRTPIVVYPWATINAAPDPLGQDLATIKDIISDILNDGGIIVVSAGNAQRRSALADTFPSTLEREFKRTLQTNRQAFIVVGAVKSKGNFWNEAGSIATFSQRSVIGREGEYWAPGEAIRCAGPNGHQFADGTSFAAPMVGFTSFDAYKLLNKDNRSPDSF
ncbi:MAG: hypothetical protein Q9215_007343 [Flavoplaca cf. flavocitrina]